MKKIVKVGNAQGFWGDDIDAPRRLLSQQPDLDFLTMDYLAEVSLSIMAAQQERRPELGYPKDCVEAIRSLASHWKAGLVTRVITNGGGLNPRGCARACVEALRSEGCTGIRIAVVEGDNVLENIVDSVRYDRNIDSFENLETHEPITEIVSQLVTANAYLGIAPVCEALQTGADIVLTGRVCDPSLVCAPCAHHFGWLENDWDKIAGGLIAGHVIECGTQTTGGISTDWLRVPEKETIGFPLVEMSEDGSFIVTKPVESGGWVTEETVKEQLLYEIADPRNYLSPDACVSFLDLEVVQQGQDRVRVFGAKGTPPPSMLKVSATYREGYWSQATLTVFGRNAVEKARKCGELITGRVRGAGYDLEKTAIECLGSGACAPGIFTRDDLMETVLRVAVFDSHKEAVDRFTREVAPLVTSGPQGLTGFSAGRPRTSPVFGYWPCLIESSEINHSITVFDV